MTSSEYMSGRKQYGRPQAALFSDNPGTLIDGFYVPTGYEVGAAIPVGTSSSLVDQFLILSDHNRDPISMKPERIEKRERTINGRMRSYHIADKLTISLSWNDLPSRAFSGNPSFNSTGNTELFDSGSATAPDSRYTVDGGAGGVELLNWYETHKGPFWLFLSYDKYTNFEDKPNPYAHLGQYSQVVQVYFSNFDYSVQKRGGSNFDLWNVSLSLEEA